MESSWYLYYCLDMFSLIRCTSIRNRLQPLPLVHEIHKILIFAQKYAKGELWPISKPWFYSYFASKSRNYLLWYDKAYADSLRIHLPGTL